MSRIGPALASRRVALALLLAASALSAGCGAPLVSAPLSCDPRDPRQVDWNRELSPELQGGERAPGCQAALP